MQTQRATGRRAIARHDVEDPVRDTGLGGQFGQAQCRKWRLLGRFQHNRVSYGQRGGGFPRGHVQWEVPWGNGANDAKGDATDQCQIAGTGGGNLVIDLVNGLGIPLEEMRGPRRVDGGGISDQLAHVEAVQQRHLFQIVPDQIGQFQHHRLAVPRCHA